MAVELVQARADQERMLVLSDRHRIARDLHDQVIQRLFATGLSLQGIAGAVPAGDDVTGQQQRLRRVVSDIDETIRQIRSSVFELGETGAAGSARGRLLAVIADVGRVLPAEVSVQVDEAVDQIESDSLISDAAAVLREGLSNVARHASATVVDVQVRIAGRVLLVEISDDGVGIGASGRRSGLDNLRQRALARGGNLVLDPAPAYLRSGPDRPGTRISWTVPLA
jgi:signal transduction histidine kinase